MALQGSGAISFLQIQTEFTGANPISMSEYYRGGSYVPTSVGIPAGAWSAYGADVSSTHFMYDRYYDRLYIRWDGVVKFLGFNASNVYPVFAQDGYDYEPGSAQYFQSTRYYYQARRRTTSSGSETVNTGIPASGSISMNQFYGGRKT